MSDIREEFEAWWKSVPKGDGRYQSTKKDLAIAAFEFAYQAGRAASGKDAERFRLAIAYEDNASTLYCACINHGCDAEAVRREFDEEVIDFSAIEQENSND